MVINRRICKVILVSGLLATVILTSKRRAVCGTTTSEKIHVNIGLPSVTKLPGCRYQRRDTRCKGSVSESTLFNFGSKTTRKG